jgi:tetratricopeptide (TPR) repeat protein
VSVVFRLALVSAAVVAVAAAPANAGTREDAIRARELFQSGQVHYDLKEYAEALKEFKDAYRVVQDPVLLFNIAQCHWMLGQNQEALGFYRNYLRRAPEAPNRPTVEKRVQEIERDIQSGKKATQPTAPRTVEPSLAVVPAAPRVATPPTVTIMPSGEPPTPAPGGEARPVYRRWWFWTGVGVVVIGAVATAVALSGRGDIGDCRGLSPCRMVGK